MLFLFYLIFAIILVLTNANTGKYSPKTCQISDSNPQPNWTSIPKRIINLDTEPQYRWTEVATEYATQITTMVNEFVNHLYKLPGSKWNDFMDYLNINQNMLLDRLPNNYGDEIRGIQKSTGLNMSSLLAFNFGYEIMGACASVTAQDINGHMYHARNLDFGLFLGSDKNAGPNNNFQWTNTDLLRQITVQTDFQKDGKTLYSTISYIGYIGLLTGVRKNGVTVTVNTRFDNNYDKFFKDWIVNSNNSASLLSMTLRSQIEDDKIGMDFTTYWSKISTTNFVGPAYAIIGGPKSGQGIVITIGPNLTAPIDTWMITDRDGMPKNAILSNKFYVLQTNYDHWTKPPLIDDRETAAYYCMDNVITKYGVSKDSMYNLLAAMPNRNRLTTYTAIMDCAEGTIDATLQYCYEDNCSPW